VHETLKIMEDAIVAADLKGQIFVKLDMDADSFYKAEEKKYDFENAKKHTEQEEMEDTYLKFLTDRPCIKILEDPFTSTENVSWHRFNKKCLDKGVKVELASKKINTVEAYDKFKEPLNKDDFPGVKPPDLIDKINENLAHISYTELDIRDCLSLQKIFTKYKELKQALGTTGIEPVVSDWPYTLRDDYLLEIFTGMRVSSCTYGLPITAERYDAMNRYMLVCEESIQKRDPFVNVKSEEKLEPSEKISDGHKTGLSNKNLKA